MRHNLTKEALSDLLQLIRLHLPVPNQYPSSLHRLEKQFHDLRYPYTLHYFCVRCLGSVKESERVCSNTYCNSILDNGSISSFIEVPIDLQLKTILERMFIKVCKFMHIHVHM